MRKSTSIILIAMLSFVSLNLLSQSALDQKNGFKDFTLGDKFYKWSSNLSYFNTLQSGIKVYKYNGTCCRSVYGYGIPEIRIGFDSNDELTAIWLTTEMFQKGYEIDKKYTEYGATKDFEKIRDNIESQFGQADGVDGGDGNTALTLYWVGTKVWMYLSYEYLGVRNGDRSSILLSKVIP